MEHETDALLKKYVADTGVRSSTRVETDFERIAQALPPEEVTCGLSEAFRSDQTPSFDQLVGQSFAQGDAEQRVGMLNQLLDTASPTVVQSLLETGLLPEPITPEGERGLVMSAHHANQLHPSLVQHIAYVTHQEDPAVVDRLCNYYAIDPALARTLGGVTLSVALEKIAQDR